MQYENIRLEGANAFYSKGEKSRKLNPYDLHTLEWYAWDTGWIKTFENYKCWCKYRNSFLYFIIIFLLIIMFLYLEH